MSMTTADIETMISKAFVLVEASKLSLDDEFMKFKPKSNREERFMKQLTRVIKNGIDDFWYPKYDPSFKEDGTGICYVPGKKPAVGKSYEWWDYTAQTFCPERHSWLCSKPERVAFVGNFTKKLVENGWKVEDAWYTACFDSKKLGHYLNSQNSKRAFENTGSREICGFCDLANTSKILEKDRVSGDIRLASGNYEEFGFVHPIADLRHNIFLGLDLDYSVGLIVLHKSASNL